MYLNQVTLIGFTGGKHRGAPSTSPIASSRSRPRAGGKTRRRANGRRVWNGVASSPTGKLADMIASIRKGTHVQVPGDLRSREYTPRGVNATETATPQRIWEVRLDSVLKLDRTAKRDEAEGRMFLGTHYRGQIEGRRKASSHLTGCP
jgi:single-strand DNA-binding protein